MSIEAVRAFFREKGIEDRVKEFSVSSATVELAAAALGCAPERIAKTLSFRVGEHVVLIVMAGDARIDNHLFKETFATKAKMLTHEEVEAEVGHAVGGVCPFAVKPDVRVYLDESLRRFDLVYPAAGSSNSAIGLTPDELAVYSGSLGWLTVTKLPDQTEA